MFRGGSYGGQEVCLIQFPNNDGFLALIETPLPTLACTTMGSWHAELD